MEETNIKNILIVKPSALGDIVQSLPIAGMLKNSFPDVKISWVVKKQFSALLKDHQWIDELILFDSKTLSRTWRSLSAYRELKVFFNQLKATDFDVAFDLQGLFRSGLIAFKSSAKRVIGQSKAREFATVFYTDKVPPDKNNPSVMDYYTKLIETIGCKKADTGFGLRVNEQDKISVQPLLSKNSLTPGGYAVLVCSSARDYKCWPVQKFAAVADMISEKFNLKIAAVGTSSEQSKIQAISQHSKAEIISFAGKTDIRQLMAVLDGSRIVISNDTGPGYIAYALGRATVIIYGPTNPARVAPGKNPRVIAAVEPFARGDVKESLKPQHRIEAVTVDMVFDKVCSWLTDDNLSKVFDND